MLMTSIGVRYNHLELELLWGTELADKLETTTPGVRMLLGMQFSFYSYLGQSFRLRHGVSFGTLTDVIFERNGRRESDYPMLYARGQLAEFFFGGKNNFWLVFSPLNVAYPTLYEMTVSLRYGFGGDTGSKKPPKRKSPALLKSKKKTKESLSALDVYFSMVLGLGWWQHHDPSVVGLAYGSVGLHWKHFELGAGFGSPAWAQFRSRGLYEFRFDIAFVSLLKDWLRLRHGVGFGFLLHNPGFDKHDQGYTVHMDPCMVDFALVSGSGFWATLIPLSIALVDGDHFSSSLAIRYEL